MAGKEGSADEKGKSAWPDLLSAAGKQLMPVLLTGASLIGFVAFAGGVIVWTRFAAAKVPPDQAVNAVPRDELVAIGSALLLLFGFFGVLALVGAFLVDRGGRATPGMARALLVFFLVEGVTTIVIADGISLMRTIAVAGLFALPIAAAIWATWVGSFVSLEDDLPTREGERPGPRGYEMFLLRGAPKPSGPTLPSGGFQGALRWIKARRELLVVHAPIIAVCFGVVGGVVIELVLGSGVALLVWLGLSFLVFLGLALRRSHKLGMKLRKELDDQREAIRRKRLERAKEEEGWGSEQGLVEAERLLNERPMRLELKLNGVVLMVFALLASVALPYALLGKFWVGVSIGAAAALTSALWRISMLSVVRVVWFGVAVFISVPLFGTLTAMARNIDDPQVQPMALIRNTDGPDEAIQGLYVTEADDRVYFATVATEGCTDELTPNSGRLEWVPKSEVVAMSVGPLQSVKEAAASALEMSYALTPAVETPAGSGSEEGPIAGAEPAAGAAVAPSTVTLDKRLEDTGPAVRPFYGAGLSLTPDNASPGQPVTLRMGAPNNNDEVHGFGRTRNGHTLRIGGVRATIATELAHQADTAEYVETEQGALLRLEKGEPYVEANGQYERLDDLDSQPLKTRFLKLIDHRVLSVGGQKMGEWNGEGDEEGIYIPIASGRTGIPVLKYPRRKVALRAPAATGGESGKPESTQLRPRPKAQAWHEREIRFLVPDNVSTGAVTVECSQLAGQPLLRVAHKPEARISVRMHAGSTRVSFDSSRSSDADGESISRRWDVAGLRRGNVPRMSVDLPPRPRAYTVRMTATDASGRASTAELRLLRLPASLFKSNEAKPHNDPVLSEARETLEAAARKQTPAAIEIDGYADDPGSGRHNVHLSLQRAERVRERLLHKPDKGVQEGATIPVRTLAYGEECPAVPGSGHSRSNRRVDVFVLEQGVSMTPPANCHPHRFQSTEWKLPAG